MRNLVIAIPMMLLSFGCQPTQDGATTLDVDAARQRIQAEAVKDDARDTMMRVMQPDPTQTAALDQAYTARNEAVGAWLAGEKGQRMIALEAEMRTAAEAKDLNGVRAATSQATPLRNELRELVASHQAAILDVFSPAQQLQWSGYEVASAMLELMAPLQLTPEQMAAIEGASIEAVARATQRGEPTPKAAAFLDLEQWAEDSVLNPEQWDGYQGIKDRNKMRSLGI